MSTSPRSDPGSGVTEPRVERAEHIGAEFDDTIDVCRTVVRSHPELRQLAHYSNAVFDFSIGRIEQDRAMQTERFQQRLRRAGETLSYSINRLDRNLQEVRTGALIRVVLHTERGALICDSVVPKENLIGLVPHVADGAPSVLLPRVTEVRSADMAMAELATDLRERISLGPANPGGYRTEQAPVAEEYAVREPALTFGMPPAQADEAIVEACRQAVRPTDLHLVAYCPDGEVAFMFDHFEHRSLGRFFTQITPVARRKFYQEFSRELGDLATELSRSVRGILDAPVQRMVLDVEQGAIWFYRVRTRTYLVGVTVDQSRVSHADDRLAELAQHIHTGNFRSLPDTR